VWHDLFLGAPAAVRVGAVRVPQWRAGVAEVVLPVAYRDVLEVLADAGQPLFGLQDMNSGSPDSMCYARARSLLRLFPMGLVPAAVSPPG
jgi:hypothetical protein